ncbi:NAT_SF domain containing protein [uncultured Caudovirales phage]|uniref:NAT_SF domain containing protein n=1 Tax=uncultured Caudovirales phage TaxID=2100421 RepID=A0A6J5NWH3_9CAUD|nr:NAT_SF domain containing protein [uncultured Caudovirales phage]
MPENNWPKGNFWSSDYSSLSDSQKMEIDDIEIETFNDKSLTPVDLFSICRSRSHAHTVLLEGDKVAAYSVVKVRDDKVQLKRLVVLKEYRNRGIGRLLHNSIIIPGGLYCALVHELSVASQIWLRSHGWRAVKIQGLYYVFYRDLRKIALDES